jgi:hypothetical protein
VPAQVPAAVELLGAMAAAHTSGCLGDHGVAVGNLVRNAVVALQVLVRREGLATVYALWSIL